MDIPIHPIHPHRNERVSAGNSETEDKQAEDKPYIVLQPLSC